MRVARIAALAAFALLGLLPAASAPVLDRARSGPCVEDPKVMRRAHMDLLLHGRDDTVLHGVRDRKHDLAGCVDCHANGADGKVVGTDGHFCQGCHAYAAVKLDCFECHSSRARDIPAVASSAEKER
jgi:[DsrC]-trisulfide reductase subunit J